MKIRKQKMKLISENESNAGITGGNDKYPCYVFFIPIHEKHCTSALFPEYSPLLMFSLKKVPSSAAYACSLPKK